LGKFFGEMLLKLPAGGDCVVSEDIFFMNKKPHRKNGNGSPCEDDAYKHGNHQLNQSERFKHC